MTVTLLEQLRDQMRALLASRQAAESTLDTMVASAEARGDGTLTDEESATLADVRGRVAALDGERAPLQARIADLQSRDEARAAADSISRSLGSPAPAGTVTVRSEERTYRPDRSTFFADLFAQTFRTGDYVGAEQRLSRHMSEVHAEQRDIGVSAGAGLIPPQFLVDAYAPTARAGRPFLNSLQSRRLPADGVSFTVPRLTTGASAAMTAEAAVFFESDPAVTDLTRSVVLVSAAIDVSRTLFMRGGALVDDVLFPDMVEALAVAGNVSAINGDGAAAQHLGVRNIVSIEAVSYTDASPTVGEMWPKLADAVQRINALRFLPASAIFMHPRRWGSITGSVDTAGRPLFDFSRTIPAVGFGAGMGDAAAYGQVVGTLMGLPVVTDASIPTNLGAGTNEDVIIVARTQDILFWESPVMSFTFEQNPSTAPGQVRLAVGQFQLFIAGRYPKSISTIGGTGLVAPTF